MFFIKQIILKTVNSLRKRRQVVIISVAIKERTSKEIGVVASKERTSKEVGITPLLVVTKWNHSKWGARDRTGQPWRPSRVVPFETRLLLVRVG